MKKKFYEISLFDQTWRVELRKGEYNIGGGLAIMMFTDEGEDFATLTVNLGFGAKERCAFIDTNNCGWALDFLQENGIARDTGITQSSGFCIYPLYKFNKNVLDEMLTI